MPAAGQPVEHMIEQSPAAKRDERLRDAIGQRPHARAKPGGEHHRGLDLSHSGFPLSQRALLQPGVRQGAQIGFIPCVERFEIGVSEVAEQIACDAWQMCQIAVLAVAHGKPRENAGDLGVPLRAEDGVGFGEGVAVETGIGLGRAVGNSDRTARARSSRALQAARLAGARRDRRPDAPKPRPGNRSRRGVEARSGPRKGADSASDNRAKRDLSAAFEPIEATATRPRKTRPSALAWPARPVMQLEIPLQKQVQLDLERFAAVIRDAVMRAAGRGQNLRRLRGAERKQPINGEHIERIEMRAPCAMSWPKTASPKSSTR